MNAIHAFLMVVAGPVLLAPVDPVNSMAEIRRVVNEEAAFIAEIDGQIVGTLGIVYADWWYSRDGFLTDRWCFVAPAFRHRGVFAALLREADALAQAAGVTFIFNGKSRRRDPALARVIYTSPRKIANGSIPTETTCASE